MVNIFTVESMAMLLGSRRHVAINPNCCFGYRKIVDSHEYSIYERPIKADKVVAAYGDTVVKQRGSKKLIYIPDARIPQLHFSINLNERVFPGLYKNSKIHQCLLLPYIRTVGQDSYLKDIRLCVFTDQGQIFHNKPARAIGFDGKSRANDVIRFEESVVWDVPGRKFPTLSQSPDVSECYYPGLPEHCYIYSPRDNKNPCFEDKYGNGGFGKTTSVVVDEKEITCSRFYKHSRSVRANPFLFIGTGTRNDKVTLIGTYRANVNEGVRICIFASSDGGREWFCKYEFSDAGEYEFQQGYSNEWGTNFGNSIALNAQFICDDLDVNIYKRNVVLPEVDDGLVDTRFAWEHKAKVSQISGTNEAIICTKSPHGLQTGNIIALQSTKSLSKDVDWLRCSQTHESGTTGGFQFKVRVIDKYSFEILELTSSYFPTLPCRHIHHINTLKDGWVIGTGEIYPNGWLLYAQQKKADTYSVVKASDQMAFLRINTNRDSVQRTMGLIIKDTPNNKVIYASDHDTLARNSLNSTSMKNISRGSTGIYVGELKDIDDRNKFDCVYDAIEPCYFFQQLGDMFVFAGQRGELGICVDPSFAKWHQERTGRLIMHHFGNYHNYYFFNDYIILRK